MLPVLNGDIIDQILLHLTDPDPLTGEYKSHGLRYLYPCIFVNREWCGLAMRILWQQPFNFEPLRAAKAMETYLKCLNYQEKVELSENGIDIDLLFQNRIGFYDDEEEVNNNFTNRNRMALDFITNSSEKPMFNYPKFLRRLYYENMYKSAEYICKYLSDLTRGDEEEEFCNVKEEELNELSEDDEIEEEEEGEVEEVEDFTIQAEVLVKSVLQLSQRKGARLNGLIFSPDSPYNDFEKYQLLENYSDMMEDVKSLDICCLFRKTYLFSIIGRMCHQVKHLHIHTFWSRHPDERHIDRTGEVIREMLSSQRKLESFHLESCKAYTRIFFPLLSLHNSSLRHIRFDQVDFRGCGEWKSVSECRNLELLEIIQCSNIDVEMVRPLISNNMLEKDFEVKYIWVNQSCKEFEEWVDKVHGIRDNLKLPNEYQKWGEASGSNNRICKRNI
ncbi:hypothetical protein C1645_731707 [Glomus cerebriforme]|uniref:F-box domain-containing protein n=1 Tax=Glomus cerebriforme TaxID=658196 RepID=A0A397TTX2_9GLOM|nr:hypothetical protein C1645_731707 [Glomus cerebriforme]